MRVSVTAALASLLVLGACLRGAPMGPEAVNRPARSGGWSVARAPQAGPSYAAQPP
jgi:hypothetical protein